MIKIELEPWEESDIKARIVERISNTIIRHEFKLYGDIPDEGCYTPYDKFKNYVANLVADRIFKYMVDNPEIRKRIDTAIDKAEKSIVATVIKNRKQVNRMRLIDADKINFEEVLGGQSDFAKDLRKATQELIDIQPTAFDKEKVIEELQSPCNYTIMAGKHFTTVDRAIEIVEKGGIG